MHVWIHIRESVCVCGSGGGGGGGGGDGGGGGGGGGGVCVCVGGGGGGGIVSYTSLSTLLNRLLKFIFNKMLTSA